MITKIINFPNIDDLDVEYFIGKSAKENFDIIDAAEPHHIWFHIAGQPSGHVIAAIPESLDRKDRVYIIKQGAVLCKQHSKFNSTKNMEIVYAFVKDLQKGDRLGSVIVKTEKTVII
jgi:predicted ribosome quality control (RQC) complex YloA/Tae2 family protein